MNNQLHAGQIVTIYDDPVTKTKEEGKARLLNQTHFDTDGLEQWEVEFIDEPGHEYSRTIFIG